MFLLIYVRTVLARIMMMMVREDGDIYIAKRGWLSKKVIQ